MDDWCALRFRVASSNGRSRSRSSAMISHSSRTGNTMFKLLSVSLASIASTLLCSKKRSSMLNVEFQRVATSCINLCVGAISISFCRARNAFAAFDDDEKYATQVRTFPTVVSNFFVTFLMTSWIVCKKQGSLGTPIILPETRMFPALSRSIKCTLVSGTFHEARQWVRTSAIVCPSCFPGMCWALRQKCLCLNSLLMKCPVRLIKGSLLHAVQISDVIEIFELSSGLSAWMAAKMLSRTSSYS